MNIVEKLLASDEPSIRFKIRVNVSGESIESSEILQLREEIRYSPRVQLLLSEREGITGSPHVYRKFTGAHWVLASLADIGYPPGDALLSPLTKSVHQCWLNQSHVNSVPVINGLARRCASQEGNALYSLLTLGLAVEKTDQLAENLMRWQWPDGGWNCDRKPETVNSSFWETLIPMRGLSLYARITGSQDAHKAVERASEVFLKRHMFKRIRDGEIMNDEFVMLHYPCYWHYDILAGLKVMAESGLISDPRCQDALDLLESKSLPDGGWAAEARYYRGAKNLSSGCDLVNWGPTRKSTMNEWVTADALFVLSASGRLKY